MQTLHLRPLLLSISTHVSSLHADSPPTHPPHTHSYNLTMTSLNITYPVAIVGDVWDRPTLDGRKTPRVFNVLPGGFLDLQFVVRLFYLPPFHPPTTKMNEMTP